MSRAGDSSIGAGERPPEAPRRGARRYRTRRTRRTWAITGLAALVLGAGACGHPAPVIYQPTAPATSATDPAAAARPEAGQGTAASSASTGSTGSPGSRGTTGTGDAPTRAQGSAATGAPPAAAPANSDADEHLIASVRRAVADNVPPDEAAAMVVAMVGKKPTVNTRAGLSIAVLRRVALVPDEAHGGERLDLASAESVIYWARPVDSLDPHLVGIQFRKDGTRAVFFAVLLPP